MMRPKSEEYGTYHNDSDKDRHAELNLSGDEWSGELDVDDSINSDLDSSYNIDNCLGGINVTI